MKTTRYFTLTLLTFVTLALIPNSFAQDPAPEYVVRVIYFIPNDREPNPEMDEKLDTIIKEAQKFYADQMEAHGFGRKTFRFEADENGDVVVHHVNGKFNDTYYQNPSTGSRIVWEEVEKQFDMSKNIYFLALEISNSSLDGNPRIYGRGFGDNLSGWAIVPASNTGADFHELGHAFGLEHDSRIDAKRIFTIPNYKDPMTTSFCAAEWLDGNRYFNLIQEAFNEDTSVEMRTPSLAIPPAGIRLQFEITDPNGLHQVQLFKPFSSYPSVISYQSLSGKRATVEFVTHELIDGQNIILRVIDKHGNFTQHSFPIEITDLLPPPEAISIPDSFLADTIRETLELPRNHTITQLDMFRLTRLSHYDTDPFFSPVRDLTFLQHAKNLRKLEISIETDNTSPLENLTKLEVLKIGRHTHIDISPLENLTNLRELVIDSELFYDISPLENLTKLEVLRLSGYLWHECPVSDISPLENLTNLHTLEIRSNQLSDISPLENLTNLEVLELATYSPHDDLLIELYQIHNIPFETDNIPHGRKPLSDISPLENLTNLHTLELRIDPLSDFNSLEKLTNLEVLTLYYNNISNITFLTQLTNLRYIALNNNKISDVSPLADLVNLEVLRLQNNPIKNRKPLFELLRKNPEVKIYLEQGGEPLPVTLSHFRAELTDAGVLLKWITESEVDNAGFYIYRSETKNGQFKVLNPAIIQGAGTTSERNEYTWTDTTAKPNVAYYYRIEDISHAGVREQLATVRMRGLVSASGKLTTRWADLKTEE